MADLILPDRMLALTTWQPWAFAIAKGWKPVENRGSRLPVKPGQVLAIHAGKAYDKDVTFPGRETRLALYDAEDEMARTGCDPPLLRNSAVLCLVRFTGAHWSRDCATEVGDEHGNTRLCTPWSRYGQFHHEVTLLAALPAPVPCSGQRGIWYLSDDVDRLVREQVAGATA